MSYAAELSLFASCKYNGGELMRTVMVGRVSERWKGVCHRNLCISIEAPLNYFDLLSYFYCSIVAKHRYQPVKAKIITIFEAGMRLRIIYSMTFVNVTTHN